MKPEERDLAHLADMLEAAREARALTGEITYEGLMQDLRTRRAFERTLEILGEAARRVSSGTRAANPEIPWHGIIGTRNALAHEYGAIDYRRLHAVAEDGIPKLIRMLEQLLSRQPPARGS